MVIEINVPDIGSDQVEVTEILVRIGDTIKVDQSLLTVEGDKASMEVPSPQAGIVKEIKIKVGDNIATGSLIMLFDSNASNTETVAKADPNTSAPEPSDVSPIIQDIAIPDMGDDEAEITEILVAVGDQVSKEQSLLTVEGDKASMEIPAPVGGKVTAIKVSTGDKVKTGALIMQFEVTDTTSSVTIAKAVEAEKKATTRSITAQSATTQTATSFALVPVNADVNNSAFSESGAYIHATPVVRRLAREFGIDLNKIQGTGRKGRILQDDVQNYVKKLIKQVETGATSGSSLPGLLPWPKIDFSKFGTIEEIEMGRIQKISGANLHRNWVIIPHVTQYDETDITELEAFRKQQNSDAEKRKLDIKYTPLVFIMKAIAKGLEAFPRVNSSLSEDGQLLTLKKYINIGIAVDTPNGLVVPVIRDVNKKTITELSYELNEFSAKARAGKLTAADMQGGCFTISSLGGIGGTAFTPIINAPEVAILGVSKSSIKTIWNGKEFTPRLMLPLSLSYDHRVIDGAEGARFITYINQVLTDIRRLVM